LYCECEEKEEEGVKIKRMREQALFLLKRESIFLSLILDSGDVQRKVESGNSKLFESLLPKCPCGKP
jgi:hypothetical protein